MDLNREINISASEVIKCGLVVLYSVLCGLLIFNYVLPLAAIWIVLLAVVTLIPVTVNSKNRYIFDIVVLLTIPLFTLYFSQLINIAGHAVYRESPSLFVYMNRLAVDNKWPVDMRFPTELMIIASVYLFLSAVRIPRKIAAIITPLPFLLFALIDYYVYMFRGSELLFPDLYGTSAAVNVISGYNLPLMIPFAGMIAPYSMLIIAIISIDFKKDIYTSGRRKDIVVTAIGFIISAIFSIILFKSFSEERITYSYMDQPSQGNGFTLNFLMSIEDFRLQRPSNYDEEEVLSLLTESREFRTDTSDSSNIIVIMNESLADLRIYSDIIGDFDEDPLNFFDSLSENTIRGYASSSVFGGRTANTEFEYLTGLSAYYLPEGYIPYSVSLRNDTYSVASFLSDNGYYTIAMHPYYGNSWNRTTVYPMLGFDRTVFAGDMKYTLEDDTIHSYLTDECAYRNIINIIEGKSDSSKLFIFMVTIQNHGGYSGILDNLDNHSYVADNIPYSEEINNYLSLVRESDRAFEELISYLSGSDEKYTVIMFGDHQPELHFNNIYTESPDARSWIIPYIIWSNYDNGLHSDHSDLTSINYLGIDTLRAAGVELPPYFSYIESLRSSYPVINSQGFIRAQGDNSPALDSNNYYSLLYYVLTRH